MFEKAIEAGTDAARRWHPESADPDGGAHCCDLCFRRFRVLVLDGPLRDLPHGVAHAIVLVVEALVTACLDQVEERHRGDPWSVLLDDGDSSWWLRRRLDVARGSLTGIALEELGRAGPQLAELRRRYTEPAVLGFLRRQLTDEVPDTWA